MNKSWIIFITDTKIYFWDYYTENLETITPSMLESKSIKSVVILSQKYISVGCSDGCIKIFDINEWTFVKTIRTAKSINLMVAYKQN